ncbi:MAG: XRE family transcriptional regulator [Flavobacteriales bacterium]|nr:XRE family transcriptional regulator [Candidatus Competibacteraceae bacterium]MCZ2443710.1 XRE family transcriptional regulator [Flavobacteriales bacterium]
MKKLSAKQERILKSVGKRIRKLRIESGYSGYDHFAWEHKLSRSSYFKLEQGRSPNLISIIRILEIHQISLSDFFKDIEQDS